ncbi:hypothetical protein IH992_06545 [Candidatus Poribacteria bacterium]|nr:hypothetical protein [Candidatus Poribacteria bacterium]
MLVPVGRKFLLLYPGIPITHSDVCRTYNPNRHLITVLTPTQAYKELGIVCESDNIVKDFEPLPPPEGTHQTTP